MAICLGIYPIFITKPIDISRFPTFPWTFFGPTSHVKHATLNVAEHRWGAVPWPCWSWRHRPTWAARNDLCRRSMRSTIVKRPGDREKIAGKHGKKHTTIDRITKIYCGSLFFNCVFSNYYITVDSIEVESLSRICRGSLVWTIVRVMSSLTMRSYHPS
jgi:hypothetical protein